MAKEKTDYISIHSGIPTESWHSTWQWLLNTKLGWIIGIVGAGVVSGIFVGASLWSRILAGFLGSVIAVLTLVVGTYVVHLACIVPIRQRNRAWCDLSRLRTDSESDLARLNKVLTSTRIELDGLRRMPATQVVVPSRYIPDRFITGRIIYLIDLLELGGREPSIIANRTVEDCEIRGPAMMGLLDGNTLDNVGFSGDPDALVVEFPENRHIIGAIGVRACVFRRCKFVDIGVIGIRGPMMEELKQWFNKKS